MIAAQKATDITKCGLTAEYCLVNDDWWMEQKLDGQRILVSVENNVPTAYNRKGTKMNLPFSVAEDFYRGFSGHEWLLDGELIGNQYHIFDLIYIPGNSICFNTPFAERRNFLERIFNLWRPNNCHLVKCARTTEDKIVLFDDCRDQDVEGVVFKKTNAVYTPGKYVKTMAKHKFVENCEVVIMELWKGGKQAASVGMLINGILTEVCGLKLTPQQLEDYTVGQVLSIRYLYATEDMHLVQPVFDRFRDDKDVEDCTWDQVKITNGVLV